MWREILVKERVKEETVGKRAVQFEMDCKDPESEKSCGEIFEEVQSESVKFNAEYDGTNSV